MGRAVERGVSALKRLDVQGGTLMNPQRHSSSANIDGKNRPEGKHGINARLGLYTSEEHVLCERHSVPASFVREGIHVNHTAPSANMLPQTIARLACSRAHLTVPLNQVPLGKLDVSMNG